MRFAKGHGTENDFVVLLDPDGAHGLSGPLAARLCDRRRGLGADGVLRAVRTAALAASGAVAKPGPLGTGQAVPAAPAGEMAGGGGRAGLGWDAAGSGLPEWFMDYRNADGSPAEMCGNGIRVFARFLARQGLAAEPEFTIATRAGLRRVSLGPAGEVTAEMGAVTALGPGRAVIGGHLYRGLRISVGNPHLAVLVDAPLAGFDLSSPPGLDPAEFPDGANVELVQVTGPAAAAMRVHERGSGETRSCGTGAVAAATAAARAAGRDEGQWRLSVPGGELSVTLGAGTALLTGPAVIVADGELDQAWLAAAGRA